MADEVRAVRFLIENEAASGPFNLMAPDLLTNVEFLWVLGRVMRRPAFMRVPAFSLRLLFGEMSIVLLEGQKAIRLQESGFAFRFPEAEAALRDLLGK
jgi:NAD dependent epimerase/dehydratase family enzyme